MLNIRHYAGEDLHALTKSVPDRLWVLTLTDKNCFQSGEFFKAFDEIKKRLDILDMEFIEIKISEYPQFATNYAITGTPTFIFVSGGEMLGRITGFEGAGAFCSKVISSFLSC